jgi:CheY-like chemotaxis protein
MSIRSTSRYFRPNRVKSVAAPKVLVVDDLRGDRTIVAAILAAGGYSVAVARDGWTALDLLAEIPFDLVVVDYQMPGIDGVETFRRAREMRPTLVGIFLTAYANINTVFPAIDVGVERVLAKPASARELLSVVQELVGPGQPPANA